MCNYDDMSGEHVEEGERDEVGMVGRVKNASG